MNIVGSIFMDVCLHVSYQSNSYEKLIYNPHPPQTPVCYFSQSAAQ